MTLLHEFMASLAVVRTAVPEEPVGVAEEGDEPIDAPVDIVDDNARVCPTRRVSWNESLGRRSFQIAMDNAKIPTLKIRVQGRLAQSTDKRMEDNNSVVGLVARSISYDTFNHSKTGGRDPRNCPATSLLSINAAGQTQRSLPQSTKLLQRQLHQAIRPLSHDDIKKSDRRWQCHRSNVSSSSSGRCNAVWGAPMRQPSRLQSPLGNSRDTQHSCDAFNKGQNLVDAIRKLSLRAAMTLTNNSDGPSWQPGDTNEDATVVCQFEKEREPEAA